MGDARRNEAEALHGLPTCRLLRHVGPVVGEGCDCITDGSELCCRGDVPQPEEATHVLSHLSVPPMDVLVGGGYSSSTMGQVRYWTGAGGGVRGRGCRTNLFVMSCLACSMESERSTLKRVFMASSWCVVCPHIQ